MAKVSRPTLATQKAHANIHTAFEKAVRNIANIPLGQEEVDPRTHKKRLEEKKVEPGFDTTLSKLLYQMRADQQQLQPAQSDQSDQPDQSDQSESDEAPKEQILPPQNYPAFPTQEQ